MTTRIDVHTHFYPSSYLAALERRSDIPRVYRDGAVRRFVIFPEEHADPRIGRTIEDGWWTVAGKVGFMEENDISQSVISLRQSLAGTLRGSGGRRAGAGGQQRAGGVGGDHRRPSRGSRGSPGHRSG